MAVRHWLRFLTYTFLLERLPKQINAFRFPIETYSNRFANKSSGASNGNRRWPRLVNASRLQDGRQ